MPREPPRALGPRLAAARRETGLTGRELAVRAGVSQATISGIERGRDVGHGTLQRLVASLPSLDPRSVLGRPAGGPRPDSVRLWAYFADLLGLRARALTLQVDVDPEGGQGYRIEVTGLRYSKGGLREPLRRAALMSTAIVGSPRAAFALRDAHPRDGRLEIEDDGVLHSFELPRDLQRGGLRYRCVVPSAGPGRSGLPGQLPHGRPFRLGFGIWIDYPVERLVLRATFAGAAPTVVRPEAWPSSVGVDPEHPLNLFADLRPHGPRWLAVDGGTAELTVDRPVPGNCHGLSWGHGEAYHHPTPSPARCRLDQAPPIGDVLAGARRRHGLSRRELARRLEVSPATVVGIESGSEPRVSTLVAYLDVLDSLSCHELLAPHEPDGRMTRQEAWSWQRDLFGMEALEEVTDLRITRKGDMRGRLHTEGLTWTPTAAQDLRLRHGLTRVPAGSRWDLESITARGRTASSRPSVRVLRRGQGPVASELRFQGTGGRRQASFTRTIKGTGQFALTRERSAALGRVRAWEALFAEPSIPTRKLRFQVRFPKPFWPARLECRVVPRSMVFTPSVEDRRERAHGPAFAFEADEARSTVRIDVAEPLVGLRYLILWWLA